MIFGENWAKYQGYSLTFWRKLAHFSHFSLYKPNQEKWFLVKIGQNTKAIALLFGENWPILATFHSTNQIKKNDFLVKIGQNTKAIALLFGENWPILATFHSTNQIKKNDFWSKLGKIPRL